MEFLPEPFRTKTVERIQLLPYEQRQQRLVLAHYKKTGFSSLQRF